MLVDEIWAIVNAKVEPVDVSRQMEYIKTHADQGYVIFYPDSQIGVVNAELHQFISVHQAKYLKQEGFTVTDYYVKTTPGYLNPDGGTRYVGVKVSW